MASGKNTGATASQPAAAAATAASAGAGTGTGTGTGPSSSIKSKIYEIQELRARRFNSDTKHMYFLVKWKDSDDKFVTWEPRQNLTAAPRFTSGLDALYAAAVQTGKPLKWSWEFYLSEPSTKPPLPIGWHSYDSVAQELMNEYFWKYCQDQTQVSDKVECVRSGKYHYEIDFQNMTQTNAVLAAHTVRPIRCTLKA